MGVGVEEEGQTPHLWPPVARSVMTLEGKHSRRRRATQPDTSRHRGTYDDADDRRETLQRHYLGRR